MAEDPTSRASPEISITADMFEYRFECCSSEWDNLLADLVRPSFSLWTGLGEGGFNGGLVDRWWLRDLSWMRQKHRPSSWGESHRISNDFEPLMATVGYWASTSWLHPSERSMTVMDHERAANSPGWV